MSEGDERHRYERAAAVVGTVVEAKAAELFAELGAVQQAVLADVRRRTDAIVGAATRRATGTARTVVAWSLALVPGPLAAGYRSRSPSSATASAATASAASSATASAASSATASVESPAGTRP
jgi:hypothetical protein